MLRHGGQSSFPPSSASQEMMAMASQVAEVAYQQGRISPNVRRALSNATYYHEAVVDAGLPWSFLETQQHINQTARALSSSLGLLSSNTSVNAKDTKEHDKFAVLGFESKRGRFGSGIFDQQMKQFFQAAKTKSNLVDAMANAVAKDYSSSMGTQDYLGHFLGAATFVIGLAAPMVGAVGGIVAGFVLDLLGDSGLFGPSSDQILYEKIMKEMGAYVDKSIVMANVNYIRSNLESLAEELTWMPSLFLITCQHDAAKISYAIRNNENCQETETPHSERWVTSVAPLAEFIVMLQTALIGSIGKHEMVQQSGIAAARIQHLLTGGAKSWQTWATRCIPRVKKFYREALNWRLLTKSKLKQYGRGQRTYWKETGESKQGLEGENGGDVISPKCYFGACSSHLYCHSDTQLCDADDMEKYIDIMYNKKQLLVKHVKNFFLYSLGHVDEDADGTEWVKINQWTGGMYVKNREAYGTTHTAGPGDGKLADTVITEALSFSAKEGINYFKVTSGRASKNLYMKTQNAAVYDDSKLRFGLPENSAGKGTQLNVAMSLPATFYNLFLNKRIDVWGFKHDQSCNRYFMEIHNGDECYYGDGGGNTNKRCFSGGASCKDGVWTHHAPLRNIRMYLRID
eukprot:Skav233195  [mRNA]  locus=scaffold24:371559:377586:- [translate_table: standard]